MTPAGEALLYSLLCMQTIEGLTEFASCAMYCTLRQELLALCEHKRSVKRAGVGLNVCRKVMSAGRRRPVALSLNVLAKAMAACALRRSTLRCVFKALQTPMLTKGGCQGPADQMRGRQWMGLGSFFLHRPQLP